MESTDFYCDYVLSGRIHVEKIYESEEVLAFFHTKPTYEFHGVVIPKTHILNIMSLEGESERIWGEMLKGIQNVVNICGLESFRIISNTGAYQDSKHLHVHVVSGKKIEKES